MITIVTLLGILIFYISGIKAAPTPHLEWLSGIQSLLSFAVLLLYGMWLKTRAKRRESLSEKSSPLLSEIDAPSSHFALFVLPLLALGSFVPPLLFDAGYWNDSRGVISLHFLLIALFLDLFLWTMRKKTIDLHIGEEKDLGSYKAHIDGAIQAGLRGTATDRITLAQRGLSLLPTGFSDRVTDLEYRALYLFDNLEVFARRSIDKTLFPLTQEILGRVIRLSGNLLSQLPSLATAGIETGGRIIQALVQKGYLETAEKGLFTFVQGVRSLKYLPVGLGDFLIRVVIEVEKGIESIYLADKTRSVKSLMVPLAELKRVFQEERFASHPETLLGQRELDRVVGVFKTLETVLLTTPGASQKKLEESPEIEELPPELGGGL